jgi:hypothetical protein
MSCGCGTPGCVQPCKTSAKDKQVFIVNPLTGELEVALSFNADRIVTHEKNAIGNPLLLLDMCFGATQDIAFLIVTDSCGNVVTT